MTTLTAPEQRQATFIRDCRNLAAALEELTALSKNMQDKYTGLALGDILQATGFVPATFFFGANTDLEPDAIINCMSGVVPALLALVATHKTTITQLSNDSRLYWDSATQSTN